MVSSGRMTKASTTGQSSKVHIDGDRPWAAPATALHHLDLPCTVMACAQHLPALGQQLIWGDVLTQGCFLNGNRSFQHNKYLLSATCKPGPGEMVVNKQRKGLCPHSTHGLKQWTLEHLAMAGDVFDCHDLGRRHLEDREVGHPMMHRTT